MTPVSIAPPTALRLSHRQLLLLVTICSAILVIGRFNDIPVGSFWDDAHYIILAESLADGTGYRLTNLPGAPVEEAFPPGYPLLLAPLVTLFPENFVPLKLLSLIFWLASLPLVYQLFNRRFTPPIALGLWAAVALNPHLVGMATTVMSEAPYLFLTLLSLVLFDRWQAEENGRFTWHLPAALGIAALSVAVRTVGIMLLAALLVMLVARYGRRYWKWLIGLGFLLVPLALFNAGRGGVMVFSPLYWRHVTYIGPRVQQFVQSWQEAVALSARITADSILPIIDTGIVTTWLTPVGAQAIAVAICLVLFTGLGMRLWRRDVTALYATFYLLLLYIWVIYTDELRLRLLLPMIPIFYLGIGTIIVTVADKLQPSARAKPGRIMLVIGIFVLLALTRNLHDWQQPIAGRVVDLTAGTAWLRANTPPDAVILSSNATPEYLYHRRPTVYMPGSFSRTPGLDIQGYIDQFDIDYIVVRPHLHQWDNPELILDTFMRTQMLPFLLDNPDRYRPVYRDDAHNLTIFEVMQQNSES